MNKRGFTLIELLVVIVILGILITLGSKGLRAARLSAKKAQARVEASSIETAVKAYVNRYGQLPLAEFNEDLTFALSDDSKSDSVSEALISTLTLAAGAEDELNAARVVFLEPQLGGEDGTFRDPWGYQYRVALDTDYDGQLLIEGETIRRKVAVASIGLYVENGGSDTNDLVATWR